MSLLKLNNIGKIYVSENNVTVGIREVNLSFDKGEFVAITGKSGSGKSTLLNVISGMDSYEEGELFIEGKPTSHYLQPDWEEYRKEYISFIFQDYNIIESFTVLENVELALMHIEDKKARRKRAVELIELVGLASHMKHKGSKLSGGQKQRTVIARALAKDSPIILADEPTGNLDSATSKEIIDLLRHVSEDKLVIVVTHNYDDFADFATRHIRIHDGFIEFDHAISEPKKISKVEKPQKDEKPSVKKQITSLVKDGISLGLSIFKSKPRLTVFLCLLMVIGMLGIFAVTALTGDSVDAFKPSYMFSHIDGRLVITHQSGRALSDEEIANLATKYGAESYIHVDSMLDEASNTIVSIPSENNVDGYRRVSFKCRYGEDYGDNIIGRYPENVDEVFLYIPVYLKNEFGSDSIKLDHIAMNGMNLKVVGVKYFYDNNKDAKCLFTYEGFRVATAANYLARSSGSIYVAIDRLGGNQVDEQISLYSIVPSFDLDADKVYIDSGRYNTIITTEKNIQASVSLNMVYYNYDNYYNGPAKVTNFNRVFSNSQLTGDKPNLPEANFNNDRLVVSDEILLDIAYTVLNDSYSQASLFFENDAKAISASELIKEEGYLAVPSVTTYSTDAANAIFTVAGAIFTAVFWLLAVIFMAFFINLCSLRAVESFKNDLAIMRSMGITAKVIKVGIYVRMVLCLIPAIIILFAFAILIYTSEFNMYFTYLYFWQYAVIILGMLILTVRTTKKQIFRLFTESVKKSLKGGNDQ